MCVRCESPVAIVWHEVDLTDKQAVRTEIFHREKLLKMASSLPDSLEFKKLFVEEAQTMYDEMVDHYSKWFTDVWKKATS